jgi:hypothetical protein
MKTRRSRTRRPPYRDRARRRRAANLLNLLVAGACLAAMWLMANLLSARHYARTFWSLPVVEPLSPRLRALLASRGRPPVKLVALLREGNGLLGPTEDLFRECAALSEKVEIELVQPDRDVARAEELERTYRLGDEECLLVAAGGKFRKIPAAACWGAETENAPVRYEGESRIAEALVALGEDAPRTVYFATGHGERDIDDFGRRDGYSRIAARLRAENLDVAQVNLLDARTVPSDCDLLVFAGPDHPLTGFECSLLRQYLNDKGRILFLLDARTDTGLEGLLREWGVELADDIVLDPSRTLGGRELYVTAYPGHPIVKPLSRIASVFFLPRSVMPAAQKVEGVTVSDLACTSSRGWAERPKSEEMAMRFDPASDRKGPISVAVAVERGPVPGVHVQIRPTRLVVVGDADFASNGGLLAANEDFFLNSVNWLLERQELIGRIPMPDGAAAVVMDAHQLQRLFAVLVAGLPALVFAAGWLLLRTRRR